MAHDPEITSETIEAQQPRWTMRGVIKELKHYSTFLIYFSFSVSLLSIYIASKSAHREQVRHQDEKSLEAVLQFLQRFESLILDLKPDVTDKKLDPERYFLRFWNLQLVQHIYYTKQLIPDDVYAIWMRARFYEWLDNESIGGKFYRDSYEEYIRRNRLDGSDFDKAMRNAFTGQHPLTKGTVSAPTPAPSPANHAVTPISTP